MDLERAERYGQIAGQLAAVGNARMPPRPDRAAQDQAPLFEIFLPLCLTRRIRRGPSLDPDLVRQVSTRHERVFRHQDAAADVSDTNAYSALASRPQAAIREGFQAAVSRDVSGLLPKTAESHELVVEFNLLNAVRQRGYRGADAHEPRAVAFAYAAFLDTRRVCRLMKPGAPAGLCRNVSTRRRRD